MNPATPHLTSLDFDRLSLGRLATTEATPLQGHLDACPACRAQQQARLALAEQFAREVLPCSLPVVRERLVPNPRRHMRLWGLALAPVACGALLLLVLLRGGPDRGSDPRASVTNPAANLPDDLGVKGGNGLFTYARQSGKVKRLASGSSVAAGDALRFVVETGDHRYLLLAGVDGGGHASAYFPLGQWQGAPVTPHVRFEVPGSLVLDDAPGPERIFALLSARPLPGDRIRQQLEELARRGPQAIRATEAAGVPETETWSIVLEKRN